MSNRDRRNTRDAIEVPSAVFVKNVLLLSLDEHKRLLVKSEDRLGNMCPAQLMHFLVRGSRIGLRRIIEVWQLRFRRRQRVRLRRKSGEGSR